MIILKCVISIVLCKLILLHLVPLSESSGGPHRRSQSEVPGYQGDEAHCDPFTDISDTLPQKYATLPRNRNPFEGEPGQLWDQAERKEKKEKVRLLERVTGKKEGRKTSNGGRLGSAGDLRAPNPFSGEPPADTNPFSSNYKPRSPMLYFNIYQKKTQNFKCVWMLYLYFLSNTRTDLNIHYFAIITICNKNTEMRMEKDTKTGSKT